MPDFKDHILGAIRKNGYFSYNRYSWRQKARYSRIIEQLKAAEVIDIEIYKPADWRLVKGPQWNRRA
jgi:hypothetical protein